ncbi:MAG: ATP-binding protein [Actinomycetota bacterium]|nr:ATP-binding protein [Actinomycetota bacterium]
MSDWGDEGHDPKQGEKSGRSMAPRRGFHVSISLCLPRDELSVPVVRHLVNHALEEVGVVNDDAYDVELALAEACANVLTHSGPGDAYDVSIEIGPELCEIRVIDLGHGYDFHSLSREMSDLHAESGRGIALMDALMDRVRFTSAPERGTIVHLIKQLRFDDSRPARRLMLDALARTARETGEAPSSEC